MVFIVTTSFVAVFVREKPVDEKEEDEGWVKSFMYKITAFYVQHDCILSIELLQFMYKIT